MKVVGITSGDILGVGPVILLELMEDGFFREPDAFCFFVPDAARDRFEPFIDLFKFTFVEPELEPSFDCLVSALKSADVNRIDGIVTMPVTKSQWSQKGILYRGHTDLFRSRYPERDIIMAFYSPGLMIILVTDHIPLKEVPYSCSPERIKNTLKRTSEFIKRTSILIDPVYYLLGINPHAGEDGLIGTEELAIKESIPEIQSELSIEIVGPVSGEWAWTNALESKQHTVIVASYHDQGLLPAKVMSDRIWVHLSLGLPYIRTSPYHGSARDIVAKGIKPDNAGTIEAIRLCCRLLEMEYACS